MFQLEGLDAIQVSKLSNVFRIRITLLTLLNSFYVCEGEGASRVDMLYCKPTLDLD